MLHDIFTALCTGKQAGLACPRGSVIGATIIAHMADCSCCVLQPGKWAIEHMGRKYANHQNGAVCSEQAVFRGSLYRNVCRMLRGTFDCM